MVRPGPAAGAPGAWCRKASRPPSRKREEGLWVVSAGSRPPQYVPMIVEADSHLAWPSKNATLLPPLWAV